MLTDEEIEAALGLRDISELDLDNSRRVIASYEAKLREQEPVLWRYKHADEQKWTIAEPRNSYVNTVEDTVNDIKHYISKGYAYILQPLFEHPAPIPEGWRPIDGECNHVGTIVTLHQSGDVRVSHSNWVGKDMCKPYNRPAMPAYMSTIDDGWSHWMPIPAMAAVRSGE